MSNAAIWLAGHKPVLKILPYNSHKKQIEQEIKAEKFSGSGVENNSPKTLHWPFRLQSQQ
jgi:hypothetical protein